MKVVPILQQQFGRYCTVLDRQGEHAAVEVRAHLLAGLAEQLAGWGDRIEVVSPRSCGLNWFASELNSSLTITKHHSEAAP